MVRHSCGLLGIGKQRAKEGGRYNSSGGNPSFPQNETSPLEAFAHYFMIMLRTGEESSSPLSEADCTFMEAS